MDALGAKKRIYSMLLAVINRFLHWMVVGVVSPILVLLILSKNVTLPQSGLIMSILSTSVILFELPSGIISDRIGRKQIYLVSQVLFLSSFLILIFANDLFAVIIGFIFFGTARAFSSGSIESDFIDIYIRKYGSERLGKLITGMNIGETMGLAIGALIGGLLPGTAKIMVPNSNEFIFNIAFQIVLTLILISITILFHESHFEKKHIPTRVFIMESYLTVKNSGILKILLLGVFIWGFSFLSIELYWQPRLKEIVINKNNMAIFGYLNSAYFIFAGIGTLLIGKIIAKYKINNFYSISVLRLILGFFLIILAFQKTVFFFSLFYLLIMCSNGMLNVPEGTTFNLSIPEDKRSSLLSLSSLIMQLGGICASVCFSLVVANIGIELIWIISGVLFASSSSFYFLYKNKENST